MSRLLALAAVPALGLLVLAPASARAQGNGPCTHQGRQVQCPPGLPPGSGSINFVPGGTNWRNSATGAIVFVPSTTFPPFVAMPPPTTPPGPTTQPGPGQPSGDPVPSGGPVLVPLNTRGLLTLTQPSDRDAGEPLPPPAELGKALRRRFAEADLKEATAAADAAVKVYKGVVADLGVADGVSDAQGFATRDRVIVTRGTFPDLRGVVVRITPELRAAHARYEEAVENDRRSPTNENQEARLRASRDYNAAADAAPVDQAATDRLQRAADASRRAVRAEGDAKEALDDLDEKPPSPMQGLRERSAPEVEESDADKAPTFEPFKDQGAVDDVM